MNLKCLSILGIRLMAIYVSISGLLAIGYFLQIPQSNEDLGKYILYTAGIPFVVGCVLWFIAPKLAKLMFSTENEEKVVLELSYDQTLSLGIKFIGMITFLKSIPMFIGCIGVLIENAKGSINAGHLTYSSLVISIIYMAIGIYLFTKTKPFLKS